jgi:hypothetical protein
VRSRILLGVSAWLLGAVSATAGSLYAVDQLGEGLLAQHSKEISVATVNAELALENSDQSASAMPAHSPLARHPAPKVRHSSTARPARPVRPASKLLTSSGGTAAASCENGLAHLLYWSPGQGFEADDVNAGPSLVASVSFTNSSGGVVMRVICGAGGVPQAHVSALSWGGSQHDQ